LSYQNYYENEEQQKPGTSRILLRILLVAAVLAVAGLLIAGVVRSIYEEQSWEDLEELFPDRFPDPFPDQGPGIFDPPQESGSTTPPAPTPLPTSRPMADLDGQAPAIIDDTNPISDIAEGVADSIVGVENYVTAFGAEEPKLMQGTGSGFIVSSEGYILTNAHVVQGAERIMITLMSGEELEAELMGADNYMDVAVLKVEREGLPALAIGDSEALRVGEFVVAVGNPLGRELEGSVTFGIVSARARSITIDGITNSYIQTDAAINFGNSGGPLLNMRGEVVGINTAKSVYAGIDQFGNVVNAEGLGFALPIQDAMEVARMLITEGRIRRPAVGITVITLTEEEARSRGLDEPGVLVYAVVNGGPAEKAGIRPDDVILSFNGTTVTNQDQLTDMIDTLRVEDVVEFEILRGTERLHISVPLGDLNELDYDNQTMGEFAEESE